jgi:hypothetical protein
VTRSARRLRDEVNAVFVEHTTPVAADAYRRLLFGPRSSMNEAYQRLFTSVPAETVGLVVERPESAVLATGIERWLEGHGGPILVRGDRGVGKRTLVRQVLGSLGDRVEAHWIVLGPDLDGEEDVATALGEALGVGQSGGFVDLTERVGFSRTLGADAVRKAVVLANVERLFRRTPEGVERIRRVFDLVASTSEQILWILTMAEPAARILAPALELDGRFPVRLSVPPMSVDELERVLTRRHRLSGYELRHAHHSPSLHEWIRQPGAAWRTRNRSPHAMVERLHLLSGGNVRQAMRLWLASARTDPEDAARVVVGPLDAMPDDLLTDLPLNSRVLLAALLIHGPLTLEQLSHATHRESRTLDAEITHLMHLGLVSFRAEAPVRDGGARFIEIRTRLIVPLTGELRACNLI